MQTKIVYSRLHNITCVNKVGRLIRALYYYVEGIDGAGDDEMEEYYYYGLEPGQGYAGIA